MFQLHPCSADARHFDKKLGNAQPCTSRNGKNHTVLEESSPSAATVCRGSRSAAGLVLVLPSVANARTVSTVYQAQARLSQTAVSKQAATSRQHVWKDGQEEAGTQDPSRRREKQHQKMLTRQEARCSLHQELKAEVWKTHPSDPAFTKISSSIQKMTEHPVYARHRRRRADAYGAHGGSAIHM